MGLLLAVDDEPDMLTLIKVIIEGYSDYQPETFAEVSIVILHYQNIA